MEQQLVKNKQSLAGKVALVTGGSRGIGRATALALARDGADVIINYVHYAEEAEMVAATIRKLGRQSVTHQADVGNPLEVIAMFRGIVDTFGRLDILVNNAGVALLTDLPVISDIRETNPVINTEAFEAWQTMIQVNLTGAYLCSQAAAPLLSATGEGRIVNISSLSAVHGGGPPGYVVSKAGLLGLTRSLAQQLGGAGVTVNAIIPGGITTDMTPQFYPTPEDLTRTIARTPVGRYGNPEDIAEAITFLASSQASFITGQMLAVDGGRGWSQQHIPNEEVENNASN